VEHRAWRMLSAARSRTMNFRVGERRGDFLLKGPVEGGVLVFRPFAKTDQMLLETIDGIPSRPTFAFIGGSILSWIVAGRMGVAPIGDMLNEGRPAAASGPLDRPVFRRADRKEVVAVDAQPRYLVGIGAGGEGGT